MNLRRNGSAAACLLFSAAQAANPPARHVVEVSVPGRLKMERTAGDLLVSYDPASLRKVKITVGEKMAVGIRDELRVYGPGEARPLQPRSFSLNSIDEATPAVPLTQDWIAEPGKRSVVEHDLSLFETDVPPEHMWSPASSGKYRVLWEKRLKASK